MHNEDVWPEEKVPGDLDKLREAKWVEMNKAEMERHKSCFFPV